MLLVYVLYDDVHGDHDHGDYVHGDHDHDGHAHDGVHDLHVYDRGNGYDCDHDDCAHDYVHDCVHDCDHDYAHDCILHHRAHDHVRLRIPFAFLSFTLFIFRKKTASA